MMMKSMNYWHKLKAHKNKLILENFKSILIGMILMCSSIQGFCQTVEETYLSLFNESTENKLCGEGIELLRDSVFVFHKGCEQFLKTSTGKWKIIGNTLYVHPLDLEQNKPIKSILFENNENESSLEITILDKNNVPIPNFFVTPIPEYLDDVLIESPETQIDITVSGKTNKTIKIAPKTTDKNGTVILEWNKKTKIKLSSLLNMNQEYMLSNLEHNKLTIKLAINSIYFQIPSLGWTEEFPTTIKDKTGTTYKVSVEKTNSQIKKR